jgi:hypothetical protein
MKWYEYQMFKDCAGLACKKINQPGNSPGLQLVEYVWKTDLPATSGDFWKCVAEKGKAYGISIQSDNNAASKPSCAASCSFAGCGKCSDAAGTGVIKGYVYDAVYQQVVPNARVSLMSKGVKVDEVFTDENGYFTFGILNDRPECNTYRLVIDMYQNNPCTDQPVSDGVNCRKDVNAPYTYPETIDEGQLGGYFPFTSETFSVQTFDQVFSATELEPAHVNIFPRPASGAAGAGCVSAAAGACGLLKVSSGL